MLHARGSPPCPVLAAEAVQNRHGELELHGVGAGEIAGLAGRSAGTARSGPGSAGSRRGRRSSVRVGGPGAGLLGGELRPVLAREGRGRSGSSGMSSGPGRANRPARAGCPRAGRGRGAGRAGRGRTRCGPPRAGCAPTRSSLRSGWRRWRGSRRRPTSCRAWSSSSAAMVLSAWRARTVSSALSARR